MRNLENSLHKISTRLKKLQKIHGKSELPSRSKAEAFLAAILQGLFPQLGFSLASKYLDLEKELHRLSLELEEILQPLKPRLKISLDKTLRNFFLSLPKVYVLMLSDAKAIFAGDPAAETLDEVIAAYPGFFAIAAYRIAHEFYELGVPVFPRLLSEISHQKTGIDIHPGAKIGASFFIDHGTGIVVGETTIIGKEVKLYQGVTLGALSVDKAFAGKKRHPTICDKVVIYSNATILGGETRVGRQSIIGGNVWLTHSVPAGSKVYQEGKAAVRRR